MISVTDLPVGVMAYQQIRLARSFGLPIHRYRCSRWPGCCLDSYGLTDGVPDITCIATMVAAASGRARLYRADELSEVAVLFYPASAEKRYAKHRRWPKERHIAVYLTHVVFGISQRLAGQCFLRDRTTIRYACARTEDAREDPQLDIALDILSIALEVHLTAITSFTRQKEFSNA